MHMTQRFVSTLLVLTLTFFGTVPSAPVTANNAVAGGALSGIGQITYVEGRVDRIAGADYLPVVRQENISVGDTIRTKSFSRAEIVFSDKSVLRIGENSQVQVRDLAQFFVDRGKVRILDPNGKKSLYQFETPNSKGEFEGSDAGVSYLKSATSIIALDGEVSAANVNFPDKQVRVSGGSTAYVPYDAPPANPRPYLKIEKKKFEAETSPAPITPDQGKIRKAIIGKFIGEVRVRTQNATQWHPPAVKEVLGAGDEIETGDGKVLLVLESGREVYLRENTHIKIKSMIRDPKTGTLEDILESKLGAIRANIGKQKGGSKFQIRSPVGVAAVEGTILTYFITKNASTAFFEQGHGSLTSLIKNAAIKIQPGQFGEVNATTGDITGPTETSTETLDEIERGWDIPDNTYGYSTPPGSTEVTFEKPREELDIEDESSRPFEELKPDLGSGDSGAGEQALVTLGTWGGGNDRSLYSLDNEGFRWEGEETGRIMATAFPWTGPVGFVLQLTAFSAESEGFRPLLFNSYITSFIFDEVLNPENVQSTSDGGAFFGFTAGLWSAVEGTLVALYVDPNKNVGVLTGNVNGLPDFTAGTFEASGFLQPQTLGTFPDINPDFFSSYIESSEAEGIMRGGFGGDDFIEGEIDRNEILFLVDESRENFPSLDFGIFNFQFAGNFYQGEGSSDIWNSTAGGWGEFGFYVPLEAYCWKDDEGYWLAEMGGTWADGEIRGNLLGAFLTKTHLGVMGGEVTGLSEFIEGSYGNFILQSIGVYESAPLAFFSKTGANLRDNGGDFAGKFSAYFGGVESVLIDGGLANVTVIGEMEICIEEQLAIWRDSIKSFNVLTGNKTTFDGGSYYGFTAGANNYGALRGGFAGIYIGAEGGEEEGYATGLITGGLEGTHYEDLEMFSMNGTLSSEQKETVYIEPEDLNNGDHIRFTNNAAGELVGSYDGEEGPSGEITGYDTFQTASLVSYYNGFAADWGIYRQDFGDTYYFNPEESSTWSGHMGGNDPFGFYVTEGDGYEFYDDRGYWIADVTEGTFEDDSITAHLEGRFLTNTRMGTMEGDIYGIYDGYDGEGDWNAYGVGVWEGQDLDFAGEVIDSEGEDFGTLFGGEFSGEGSPFEGFFEPQTFGSLSESLIGGTGNLAGESFIRFMGNYDLDGEEPPVLWGIEIQSSSVFNEAAVTFDGHAFWGLAGGNWSNSSVQGGARMIYILNDGGEYEGGEYSAGIISGSLDGSSYDFGRDGGMWFAEGNFTAEAKGTVEFDPEDLNDTEYYDILLTREFQTGGFSGEEAFEENNLGVFLFGGGEFSSIEGEDWGIWGGLLGGFFGFDSEEDERGNDFRVGIGGSTGGYEGEGEGYPIYFYGTAAGSLESGDSGDVAADISGVWISETGQQEQFVRVGVIEGQAAGNFSQEGGFFGEDGGLIQMAAVGSFTGVTNLDPDAINFNQIQSVLEGIAITEIGNVLALGDGNFGGQGSIAGTMDASFFSGIESSAGIWAALFNGNFSGLPEVSNPEWSMDFTGTDFAAQLSGINWQDGQWLANVNGTFGPDSTVFTGQAGGTYAGSELDPSSGTFSGVGVGTFDQGCSECT